MCLLVTPLSSHRWKSAAPRGAASYLFFLSRMKRRSGRLSPRARGIAAAGVQAGRKNALLLFFFLIIHACRRPAHLLGSRLSIERWDINFEIVKNIFAAVVIMYIVIIIIFCFVIF